MPTSTDLVTDLPADFEVFGQAVDTSMADLKGGTTGQILSKATNTDMDFVWTSANPGDITAVNTTAPLQGGATSGAVTLSVDAATTAAAGVVQLTNSTSSTSITTAAVPANVKTAYDLANAAIPKTLTSATGDTIYASSANTPARLGIGTTGQVLTVAGGVPTWATPVSGSTFATDIIVNNNVKVGKGNSSLTTNTVMGVTAGNAITTGDLATLIGYNAGKAITTGFSNTAIGAYTLETGTTGVLNSTAVGATALQGSNAEGNTGIGYAAGGSISTGAKNTMIGAETAPSLTTGSNNTCLGFGAAPTSASVSNTITLGNASIATLRCQVTSITALSDERDKKNIEPLTVGLDFVNTLKPVTFDWNMRPTTDKNGNEVAGAKIDVPDAGFIAQDFVTAEDAVGLADHLQLTYRDNPDALEITQGRLIPILVKAIQDLSAKVASLESAAKS